MSIKYRLKEVAADFGKTPKEISAIMEKFFEKPKSNTQVLTEEELNVVFDYMTQSHQIDSLEVVFSYQAKTEEKKAEAPKVEEKKAEAPKAEEKKAEAPKAEHKPVQQQRRPEP